jgi:hypothetical protein
MRLVLVVGLLIIAASPASAIGPANDAWDQCLQRWAMDLDSGSDSAMVVAEGAMGMCQPQLAAARTELQYEGMAMGLSRNDPGIEQIFQERIATKRQQIIAFILRNRRQ